MAPYALTTKKSIWISSVEVVAPVPFVTTIAREPADAVLLLIDRAAPVVAPLIEIRTIVVEAVIAELVSVRVKSAAAAIETDVNVARPDLPLTITGDAATPEAEGEVNKIPVPEVAATKFPFVAVMAPRVAVTVVPAVTEPNVAAILPAEAVMFPKVATMFPADAVTPPVVAIKPVPPVTVVPATRVVVVVNEPGAVIAAGNEMVDTPATVLTVI